MYPPIDIQYYAEDPYRVELIARLGVAITYAVRRAPCDDLMISFWIFRLQRIMRGESENMHDIAEIQWPGIDIHDEVDLAAVRGRLAPTAVGSQLHVGKCFPNAL